MKFRAVSIPGISAGVKIGGTPLVVPGQSLSLAEILERFVRNEPVAVGQPVNYGSDDIDDDLEKVAHMDLVEREEFIERQRELQRKYERQEKRKAMELKEKAEAEALRIATEKLAAEQAAKAGKV